MADSGVSAVERAIATMHDNLGEQLTVDDLARAALFSKFHFSRMFRRVTGISPGRFLSALRIAEAKRLLLTTSVTVAEVGHRVGYHSVGTFRSRFRAGVGISPITYRQLGGVVSTLPVPTANPSGASVVVRGWVHGPDGERLGRVFVGAFPTRVPEGVPVRHTVLPGPGGYRLQDLPVGTWYMVAYAVGSVEDTDIGYVGWYGPFTAQADGVARLADLHLRPIGAMDPPVLLALPDLGTGDELDLAG